MQLNVFLCMRLILASKLYINVIFLTFLCLKSLKNNPRSKHYPTNKLMMFFHRAEAETLSMPKKTQTIEKSIKKTSRQKSEKLSMDRNKFLIGN